MDEVIEAGLAVTRPPTTSSVPRGPYTEPAPHPALRSGTDAITWLVAQLDWENHLQQLRNEREIERPEVSPTGDVPAAIESNVSADRAGRAESYAGPTGTDQPLPSQPQHSRQ